MRHGRLDHQRVWAQYSAGQLPAEIGRSMGRPPDAIYVMIRKAGGIRPAPRIRSPLQLSLADREEISCGLAAGISCRAIVEGARFSVRQQVHLPLHVRGCPLVALEQRRHGGSLHQCRGQPYS